MIPYTPYNWYWFVTGKNGKAYSSKAQDYVPVTDPDFTAFTLQGGHPTVIDSEESLFDVLWPYGLEGPKTAKNFRAKKLTEAEASAKIADLEARLKSLEATR